MQQTFSDQYISIILTQFKASQRDLYPLTKNHPLSMFPLGNKKLIIYQLQSIAKIQSVQRIIIEINQTNVVIEQFVVKTFLVQFPYFPKKIEFHHTTYGQNNYVRLVSCVDYISNRITKEYKGLIVTVCDAIVSVDLNVLVEVHEKRKSDFTMLIKKKKEFSENQKKIPESEIQTDIDNVLIGDNGEILFIDMLEQYQNNGITIPPSIFRRVTKASFKKVIDAKTYIINRGIIDIIKNLNPSQIDDIKPWLVQCLVQNQTNKKLLELKKGQSINHNAYQPLRIYAHLLQQDIYMKKISNKKIYEGVNFDSLLRGTKQKQILMPNQYSFNVEANELKGSLIMKSSIVSSDAKITRSVIEDSCKIGKKVQILRSIIMGKVQIRDNCKIHDSIIADNVIIGENSNIICSYIAANCQIPDGSKLDNQLKIPSL